jgi:chemotaxis protein methyltransferase CheR
MSEAGQAPAHSDAGFLQLKQAIIARTGHHYYADKDYLLRDRLDRRLAATGCRSLRDYLSLLEKSAKGAAEWQELEAEITIGETFFFRHAEQFAALRDVILPDLIRQHGERRALRIWSAGCAVGAEPYSVAILLERLLGAALPDWTIEIIGSDINRHALAQAREGVFSEWALRGVPAAARAQDFTLMPDRRHWRIADRHRMRLRFLQHNLLSLPTEGRSAEWADFDLILCRNVLIYFSLERIAPTLSALARCLTPTGWLMVGHSDAIAALPHQVRVVELAGTLAFRPSADPGSAWLTGRRPVSVPLQPVALPPVSPEIASPEIALPEIALPAAPLPPACSPPAPSLPTPSSTEAAQASRQAPALAVIRALADAGRLADAAQACRIAIAADPLDPHLHLYDGLIAQAAGHRRDAEAALRRAVYLCGEMVMAHYHLGLLLLDGPAPEAGRRSMAQVIKLCARLPGDAILPESDGLTPRALVERVRLRLRVPGG